MKKRAIIEEKQEIRVKPRGIHTISFLDCESQLAKDMCRRIKDLKRAGKEYGDLLQNFFDQFLIGKVEYTNIVPDAGCAVIAENIANPSPAAAYNQNLSYIAVGTGNTAAAEGDTTLDTEVFRDSVDSWSRSGKISRCAVLVGYDEANSNTLAEIGGFAGDASASADSGALMSRTVLGTTIAKTDSKAIFIEIAHTISDA